MFLALDMTNENAPEAALVTVPQADDAALAKLTNGARSHPMADDAIDRMLDQADEAPDAT